MIDRGGPGVLGFPQLPPNKDNEIILPEEVMESTDVVYGWRIQQLVRAGYAFLEAEEIGLRRDIDLHKATDLLDSGCPHDVAVAILL